MLLMHTMQCTSAYFYSCCYSFLCNTSQHVPKTCISYPISFLFYRVSLSVMAGQHFFFISILRLNICSERCYLILVRWVMTYTMRVWHFTSSLSGIPAASSMTFNMLLVTNWKSSTKVWTIINEELSWPFSYTVILSDTSHLESSENGM